MNNNLAKWKARTERLGSRAALKTSDLRRAASWHLSGQRFFDRYRQQILGAHRWCFIVACNNSGTSLLQSLLEKTGEVSTFPHEGQRYTQTLARANRKGHERVWSEFLEDLRLTSEQDTTRVGRLLHDWMGELQAPVRSVIVEKTTANAVRMTWLQRAFPHSCFIGMVRNGYAVAEGIRRKGHKSIGRAARHWNLVNRIMLDDAKALDRFCLLRYEDLVADSGGASHRLADFVGVDADRLREAMTGEFGFDTIRGGDASAITDLNADSLDRLTAEDKEIIYREAGEMLDYLNYRSNGSERDGA